jgi:hypothetical protein
MTDTSVGTVSGANRQGHSLANNEVGTMASSTFCTYSLPNLPGGAYRVEMQQAGFKQFVRKCVEVQIDVTSRVDASPEVGNVSGSMVVTADAPSLQTDSFSLGSVVSQSTIQRLDREEKSMPVKQIVFLEMTFRSVATPLMRIDPAAVRLMNLVPQTQIATAARNYSYVAPTFQRTDQFDIRMDQNFGASDKLVVKFSDGNSDRDSSLGGRS